MTAVLLGGSGTSISESWPKPTLLRGESLGETVVEEVIGKPILVQENVPAESGEAHFSCFELPANEVAAAPASSQGVTSPTATISSRDSFSASTYSLQESMTTLSLSEYDKQEIDQLRMELPSLSLASTQELSPLEHASLQDAKEHTDRPPPLPARNYLNAHGNREKIEEGLIESKESPASAKPLEEKLDSLSLGSNLSYPPPPPYSYQDTQPPSLVQKPYVTSSHTMTSSHMLTQQPSSAVPDANISVFQNSLQQNDSHVAVVAPTVHPSRPPMPQRDTHSSGKVKRFIGDTLVGRVARSTMTTATSTVKAGSVLSPWGDNNTVTLPNVRYRDAILFGTFAVVGAPLVDGASDLVSNALGADNFVADIISSGAGFVTTHGVIKYGLFQIVEQGIDKAGLERVIKEAQSMTRTSCCLTLLASIRHKLLDVKADVRFVGQRAAHDKWNAAKGWFVPYLFATCRLALIPRAQDFGMAEVWGPGLSGQYLIFLLISLSLHLQLPSLVSLLLHSLFYPVFDDRKESESFRARIG